MTREEREKELTELLHTQTGREVLQNLYRHLYLSPGVLTPPGFLGGQDLVELILAKEFPDE